MSNRRAGQPWIKSGHEGWPVLMRLTPECFEAFVAAISASSEPVPAMVEVLSRKAPWDEAGGSDDPVGFGASRGIREGAVICRRRPVR